MQRQLLTHTEFSLVTPLAQEVMEMPEMPFDILM